MKITVGLMRDLEKQVNNEEISYSRMVEILNETANKELLELKEKSRELLKEATKVYCHYNELIKDKNDFMDFQTLKELHELVNAT